MDVSSLFIPDLEPPVVAKPRQGSFDHPAVSAQLLAGVDALASDADLNSALGEHRSTPGDIVGLVGMELLRALSRSASWPSNGPDFVDQLFEDGRVVGVGSSEAKGKRRPSPIDHKMALRPRFSAIYRVRARGKLPFFPTPMAGIDCESTEARDQSIWSARPRRSRRTWWSVSQTPASCQSRSLRQQVIPEPQPISWGSISQGMPLLRTNRMPVSAARSGMRGRPPLGLGRSGGRSGPTASHSVSGKRGLAISREFESGNDSDSLHQNKFC